MGCPQPPCHLGKLAAEDCSAEVRRGMVETGGYASACGPEPAHVRRCSCPLPVPPAAPPVCLRQPGPLPADGPRSIGWWLML